MDAFGPLPDAQEMEYYAIDDWRSPELPSLFTCPDPLSLAPLVLAQTADLRLPTPSMHLQLNTEPDFMATSEISHELYRQKDGLLERLVSILDENPLPTNMYDS